MRQYIGARYVPIFFNVNGSNNWLPNYAYEPLTIVTYNNVSYTSSQQVPASVGNPAENPTYWVPTGNYNAFINNLQNQITQNENDIENNSNLISSYRNQNNKKILMIGDSYESYPAGGWGAPLKIYMGLNNIPCNIYGKSGAGFYNDWYDMLTNVEDIASYTDCYFVGGVNDWGQDYGDNMALCANYCKQNGITMHIINIGSRLGKYGSARTFAITQGTSAANLGISYYPYGYQWFHSSDSFVDGLHPTAEAEVRCARNLVNILLNGKIIPRYEAAFQDGTWGNIVTFYEDYMSIRTINMYLVLPELTPGNSARLPAPSFIMGAGYEWPIKLKLGEGALYDFSLRFVWDEDNNKMMMDVINMSSQTTAAGNYLPYNTPFLTYLPLEFF